MHTLCAFCKTLKTRPNVSEAKVKLNLLKPKFPSSQHCWRHWLTTLHTTKQKIKSKKNHQPTTMKWKCKEASVVISSFILNFFLFLLFFEWWSTQLLGTSNKQNWRFEEAATCLRQKLPFVSRKQKKQKNSHSTTMNFEKRHYYCWPKYKIRTKNWNQKSSWRLILNSRSCWLVVVVSVHRFFAKGLSHHLVLCGKKAIICCCCLSWWWR